jgi:hypothetical protein
MFFYTARWGLWLLVWICTSAAVSAEPMRLGDRTPRWVAIEFEDSPRDRPDLLDGAYTQAFSAWLEPDEAGRVTVRLSGDILENSLFRDNQPVAGSFSDFLWTFDGTSGDVLSAEFSGAFFYTINLGFLKSDIEAKVEAWMTTTRPGGFRPARRILDRVLIGYCDDVENQRCEAVPARRYDEERGYVNAVGYLSIDSPVKRFETFSSLGEARFSEAAVDAPVRERESEARLPAGLGR